MTLGRLATSMLIGLVLASTAHAECVFVSPEPLQDVFARGDLVFSGTLIKRELMDGISVPGGFLSETLTFAVTRIWNASVVTPKGSRQLQQVAVFHALHVEAYHFEQGIEYVLFAQTLKSSKEFPGNLPDSARPQYLIETCGGRPDRQGIRDELDAFVRAKP